MRQRWQRLALLHYQADAHALARLLPPGLSLDTWDGRAYVGLVPFSVRRSRVAMGPPMLGATSFEELNLRTYVHRGGRGPGVYFFSLDAASRLAVWGARRYYKLPYYHAHMASTPGPSGVITFTSVRATPELPVRFVCNYKPAGPPFEAPVGSLEFFLAERYLLYSWDGLRLRNARVWHRPYPLAPARAEADPDTMLATIGLAASSDAPLAHYADDLDVRIYPPRLVLETVPSVFDLARAAIALGDPEAGG